MNTAAKTIANQKQSVRALSYPDGPFDRLTHYIFRYPAKFHPPVVKTLINLYTSPRETILDPFCGSGTLLVEAMANGRNAIGIDIDPVAAFVSRIKTQPIACSALQKSAAKLLRQISPLRRPESEYEYRQFHDLSANEFVDEVRKYRISIPRIPNLFHWFRKYVLVDLARIQHLIFDMDAPKHHRDFFLLCFGSIIRNSSNADPVPVSGLEVTSYMKKINAEGRIINPYRLFQRKLSKSLVDIINFTTIIQDNKCRSNVFQGDATNITRYIRSNVDAVITSPPYHNAVDYYRRHNLEMYWLRLVSDHAERLNLIPRYIGRSRISQNHPFLRNSILSSSLSTLWEDKLRDADPIRADAFKHYVVSMQLFFTQITKRLHVGRPIILVVGKSMWNGEHIPTDELFCEIASEYFELVESYSYPIKNRYMSYTRKNVANIDKEYVIVMRKI